MDTIIHLAALAVLVSIAGLIVAVIFREMTFFKLAAAYQQQDRERLKAQIEVVTKRADSTKGAGWNGTRQFRVISKKPESNDICSFFLKPIDEKPLPPYLPGQFLTFELNPPGADAPIMRCYSLSDSHNPDFYRVSIKKVFPPQHNPSGSNYFHDHVSVNSVVKVRAPGGTFTYDVTDSRPSVFLASGVGLTPLMSMLQAACDSPDVKGREIWFFFGVRDGPEHIMKRVLQELAKVKPWLKLNICYSQPRDTDKIGVDYHHKSRVNVDLLKKVLPSNNYVYYICGPPPMMSSLIADLKAWGVPDKDVLYEAFGQETTAEVGEVTVRRAKSPAFKVKFALSDREEQYSSDKPLITLAEKCKAKISWGCRSGNCGACKTLVQSGEVSYAKPPSFTLDAGYCLPCVALVKSNLVLEA